MFFGGCAACFQAAGHVCLCVTGALACSLSSCTCLPLRVYMATSLSPFHSFSLLLPDSFSTTAITRTDPFRVHFHVSRFYCRPFIYSLFPVASPAKIILGLIEHLPQSAFSGNECNPTAELGQRRWGVQTPGRFELLQMVEWHGVAYGMFPCWRYIDQAENVLALTSGLRNGH